MKKKILLIIGSTLGLVSLVGCNKDNTPSVVKYNVTSNSETCEFNVVNSIEKGKDLSFVITLKQPFIDQGYILPNELTTEIKVGNLTLGTANYIVNEDNENNKATYLIPSAFIFGDVSLNIEGILLPPVSIKLETNKTPIKFITDEEPIIGSAYYNTIEVDRTKPGRFGIPEDVVVSITEDTRTYNLIEGQYSYNPKNGQIFITSEFVCGEITIYAPGVNYDEKDVKVTVFSDNSVSYKYVGEATKIDYFATYASIEINPGDNSYELYNEMDITVLVNGKNARFDFDFWNNQSAIINIDALINGDINIITHARKLKSIRTYLKDGAEKDASIVCSINPNLQLYETFVAYFVPLNADRYILPETLQVEVFDSEVKHLIPVADTDYIYYKDSGMFMLTNKEVLCDYLWVTAACTPKA